MKMISHSKIYLDLSDSLPYTYGQKIIEWGREFVEKNYFIFSSLEECDLIICNISNYKLFSQLKKKIVTYCCEFKDFLLEYNSYDFYIIDFTHVLCNIIYKKERIINIDSHFYYKDITEINHKSKQQRWNGSISFFVNNKTDINRSLSIADDNPYNNINIFYDFTLDSDIFQNIKNSVNNCRTIRIHNYIFDNDTCLNLISDSLMCVFYKRNLMYQFLCFYFRCFPIIFEDDILSHRFICFKKYEDVKDKVNYLTRNFSDLQSILSSMSSFQFSAINPIQHIINGVKNV